MNKLIELLRSLERDRFYGCVQIEFRAGDITIVHKEQTIKLDSMRKNPNESYTK